MTNDEQTTEKKSTGAIYLNKEEDKRLGGFLSDVSEFLWEALPPSVHEIYELSHNIEDWRGYGWLPEGYINFLNGLARLKELTGLPYSLEEDWGGLGSWEAWNKANEKAIKRAKKIRKSFDVR